MTALVKAERPRTYHELMDTMLVDLPEHSSPDGALHVVKFDVDANSLENLMLAIKSPGRQCEPGTYTQLIRNGTLWMSDTTAERRDHMMAAMAIDGARSVTSSPAESVLIGGLGLGCILRVALTSSAVRTVHVVELDQAVIDLVGPHYQAMAAELGVDLFIRQGDLLKAKWAPNAWWDVAWFDIWAHLDPDNLEAMGKLNRSYARRAGWKGCWGQEIIKDELRRGRRRRARWGW